ncbi:hypothetical protein Oscil6304_2882 [Oscillatoria acuminata PCC 6304]|uniref:Uncharacterized protein n=2 Tax=Oscillatoria acuminata TaxID=118323 RepID=K9TKD4_9CYAN|nr:hypothetical protein Oscil6304_2882 [Oscillatoria acuminata PCC 6304]
MTTNKSLEECMAAVEAAITQIQQEIAHPKSSNWLQQITGSFQDEPAFIAPPVGGFNSLLGNCSRGESPPHI